MGFLYHTDAKVSQNLQLILGLCLCLDLDKPDGDVMGESEDGESGDDGCLRQKLYVDINVIPVARLELNKKRITNNTKTAYSPL
jgi:hypothetical protein